MRPHIVVDNSVDGNSETSSSRSTLYKGRLYLGRVTGKAWSRFRLTEFLGYFFAGAAFILIASLIFHLLPSEHPTFQDRKLIGALIGVFGFGMFYMAGRRNLLAVPILTGIALLTHQFVSLQVTGVPFIGRDVILASIVAVIAGGFVRMITPTYEHIE